MFPQDEFKKYAIKHKGISSLNLHRFQTATGIYPLASPGGWQLIGRTPVKPLKLCFHKTNSKNTL